MLSLTLLIFIKDKGQNYLLQGYCFKCKGNKEIIDEKWSKTQNKRKLCQGKCIECNGKIARMCGIATLDDEEEE